MLKDDYKNAVLDADVNPQKVYTLTNIGGDDYTITDVSVYNPAGDTFGATQINEITSQVNTNTADIATNASDIENLETNTVATSGNTARFVVKPIAFPYSVNGGDWVAANGTATMVGYTSLGVTSFSTNSGNGITFGRVRDDGIGTNEADVHIKIWNNGTQTASGVATVWVLFVKDNW